MLQEPLLFSGTIADNIRYGRLEATTEEIIEAAQSANAHDFIMRLPDRYDTVLGERGTKLSGGERQRIAVARAFLKDAPILILDEPTSSIDSKTEAVILDALDRLMVGRTTFMIAHRLSTVRHADRILVLDQGRIVAQGTHEELLAVDGLYRNLHEVQNRGRRALVDSVVGVGSGTRRLNGASEHDDAPHSPYVRTATRPNGHGSDIDSISEYQHILAGTLDPCVILDQDGRCVGANDDAAALLGYPSEALVGAPWEDLAATGPSWSELLHDHLETDGHSVGRGAMRRDDQADLPTEFEVRTAALDAGTVYVVELHPLAPTGEAPHAQVDDYLFVAGIPTRRQASRQTRTRTSLA